MNNTTPRIENLAAHQKPPGGGRLIVSCMVSVDGVMESPEWSFPSFSPDLGQHVLDELREADILVLGRATYEGFLGYWPTASDDSGIAERMNSLPKLVASRTLTSAEWNASVLADAAPDLTKLKAERDATFLVLASADLVSTLTAAGLVDEYRIRVCPVLVGRGRHLFTEDVPAADLELVESRSFSGGVTALTYRARGSDPARG